MLAVAVVSFLVNVVPFAAAVLLAVYRHKKELLAGGARADWHRRLFRFVLALPRPKRYYVSWMTTLRGCFVCLAPVLASGSPAVQVVMLFGTLLTFEAVQLQLQPWRGAVDVIDAALSMLMALLLLCAATSTDLTDASENIGFAATVMISLVAAFAFAFLSHALYQDSLAQARLLQYTSEERDRDLVEKARQTEIDSVIKYEVLEWVKVKESTAMKRPIQTKWPEHLKRAELMLQKYTHRTCFVDSDHLVRLDELLDIVRSSIRRLVLVVCRLSGIRGAKGVGFGRRGQQFF